MNVLGYTSEDDANSKSTTIKSMHLCNKQILPALTKY